MNILNKSIIAAAAVVLGGGQINAQLSLGTDCGCPPLASRTVVSLSGPITSDASTIDNQARQFPAGRTDLTCDKVYIINNKIYIPSGSEVWVEPGTVFKGTNDGLTEADALIVSRGGKLYANGTESCPIIFTSAGNVPSTTNITDPLAGDPLDGTFPLNARSHWGGIIMLGFAPNNVLAIDNAALTVSDGVSGIEGLDVAESRNHYGGSDADDSSGSLKYVSIRHGGISIAANNEINGLTLGSVGRGTTLEHIEIVSNADDGIEFFGGTVDLKWATVFFCGDDGFDWDQGYNGRGQFWYSVENDSDKGWEIDGDDGGSVKPFYSDPQVYNSTMIGDGTGGDFAISAKSETQGRIANSIFTNHSTGLRIEGATTIGFYTSGEFEVLNNLWENMTTYFNADGTDISAQLAADGNLQQTGVIDYQYTIDVSTNAITDGYDPVPAVNTPNINVSAANRPPNDGFFDLVSYKGAFEPGATPWTAGYTVAALLGTDTSLVDCPTDTDRDGDTDVDDLLQLIGSYNTSCN